MGIDLSELMTPLSSDDVCGVNSEYDSLYLELDSLAVGTPPGMMGDSVIEGKDPDWRLLRKNCLELWSKTRDLRVAVYLTISSLCLDGLEGFRDGLKLLDYLVSQLWDGVWPRLDPDDDNDPTERINIFSMFSPPQGSYSDPLAFISRFRDVALVNGMPYTLRDLLFVTGADESVERSLNPAIFEAEMAAVNKEIMKNSFEVVSEIEALLEKIASDVYERTSGEGVLNFSSLMAELKVLKNFYASHISDKGELFSDINGDAIQNNESVTNSATPPKAAGSFNLNTFYPSSRGEALLVIGKCAEFFRNTEPTNPLPYLLERALRMAEMNFIELLQDMDPSSLDRVKEQLGIPRD